MTTGEPNMLQQPGLRVLDRSIYLAGYLVRLANGMSRGGSKVYHALFGIGVVEWRILSMLAIEPGLLAKDICQGLEMDKSIVSRCVRSLEAKRLLQAEPVGDNLRSYSLLLTAEGREIHDKVLALALEREQVMLEDLSADERSLLFDLLRRLTGSLEKLSEFEDALIAQTRGR
jgi:DNA-binding MarR family transcriptional regulator